MKRKFMTILMAMLVVSSMALTCYASWETASDDTMVIIEEEPVPL